MKLYKPFLTILTALALSGCVYSTQTQTWPDAQVTVSIGSDRVDGQDAVIGIGTQVSIPRRENLMDMLKGSAAASVALPTGQAGDVSQATDLSGVRAAPKDDSDISPDAGSTVTDRVLPAAIAAGNGDAETSEPLDTPDAQGAGDGPGQSAESPAQDTHPAADASGGG